jgi:hypothetical protein
LDWAHIPVPVPRLVSVPESPVVVTGQPQMMGNVVYTMPNGMMVAPPMTNPATAQPMQPAVVPVSTMPMQTTAQGAQPMGIPEMTAPQYLPGSVPPGVVGAPVPHE